jgi:hypothetical protein
MDVTSGAFTVLGTPFENPSGLAYVGGTLYGMDYNAQGLYKVDASTGTGDLVGTLGLSGDLPGIAAAGGNLYALGTLEQLYRVDPATAVPTVVGPTGITPIVDLSTVDALTIAGGGDSIYWSNRLTTDTADRMYRIDPATGMATFLGPVIGADHLTASGFIDGTFYVFTFAPNNIYSLDLNTLHATLVGTYNGIDVPVFAVAAVPEPAGIGIAGVMLIGLAAVRRRKLRERGTRSH